MKSIVVSLSALFLSLSLLSGCDKQDSTTTPPATQSETESKVDQAAESIQQAAQDTADAAETAGAEAVEATQEAVADAVEATQEAVADAVDATQEAAADAVEATQEAATDAVEATKEMASDAVQATEEATESAVEATEDAAEEATQEPTSSIHGESIYRSLCFSCHDTGIINSPKLDDKEAWAPRIAAGMDTLYTNSINGKVAMPPKGGNLALSDDEVKSAVDWMVAQVQR